MLIDSTVPHWRPKTAVVRTAKIHTVHYGLQNSLTCIISFGLYVSGDRYIFYEIYYNL